MPKSFAAVLLPKPWKSGSYREMLYSTRAAPKRPGGAHQVAQNTFHDMVVNDIADMLRSHGCSVVSEITFESIPPRWTYRADIVASPPPGKLEAPSVIEVKTSVVYEKFEEFLDEFRRDQFAMIVLLQLGNHVLTRNVRAVQVGLPIAVPLLPMRIDIVYALPGQPYKFRQIRPGDFDKLLGSP